MNKQGISATTKGCCTACDKPIVGQVSIFRPQIKPWCLTNPLQMIDVVQVVTALGRTWHPEHFVCSHCRQELGTQNFFERDGQPYCEPDYHHLFSPRCAYCNGPILDVISYWKTRPSDRFHPFCPVDSSWPRAVSFSLLCKNRFPSGRPSRLALWTDEWMDDVGQLLLRVVYHLAACCLLISAVSRPVPWSRVWTRGHRLN